MQTDYSHLYDVLGVRPDCSLETFRQAFRRHIAEYHPDRRDPAMPAADGTLPLAEVIVLHEQAMRFHGRHGRLPGATILPSTASTDRPATPSPPAAMEHPTPPPSLALDAEPAARNHRRWMPLLVLAAAAVVAIGYWQSPVSDAPHAARPAQHAVAAEAVDPLPSRLSLGMDAQTVRAIQGEPLRLRGNEWDYGPSWLRFERGHLVDWYSSPLYRLKTPAATPQESSAG